MKKIFVFLFIITLVSFFDSCKKGTATPSPASFYLINVSPGSQSLDFTIDGQIVKSGLGYEQDTGYLSTSPGLHDLQIAKTGTSTNLFDANISLTAALSYDLFVIDSINRLKPVAVADTTNVPVSDTAKLRFLNFLVGSPVLTLGVAYATDTLSRLTFSSRTFNDQSITGSKSVFQKIASGIYTFSLYNTTTDTFLVKSFPGVTLSAGKIYTIYISGVYSDTTTYPITKGTIEHN